MGLLPKSQNQINKLGDRLRDAATPADPDLDTFQALLVVYDQALSSVRDTLDSLGFAPTIRLKTTTTLVDKLRRDRRSNLSRIQDLAGARVVVEGGLDDQDRAALLISQSFSREGSIPRTTDRRVEPSFGYRAIHVVAHVGQIPVEIQIRTELQDSWAQIFERLADTWGRSIRYGHRLWTGR